ncbi:MGMT family protein [uncultured Weeksella sp.]|uniref:MGMT family protein n=1 Tax=uncultured Weeksella sp. TaxID=1161389 RepID=UPI00259B1343|nr:MGMT family protein [uncultured Weeksella sp.]
MSLDKPTNTFAEIYEIVRKIPIGKVSTYGRIAAILGSTSGARMVGYALNHAHVDSSIPAHRVVNRNGQLTGKMHFHPPQLMQQLLENEGFIIENDQIVNFKENLWP